MRAGRRRRRRRSCWLRGQGVWVGLGAGLPQRRARTWMFLASLVVILPSESLPLSFLTGMPAELTMLSLLLIRPSSTSQLPSIKRQNSAGAAHGPPPASPPPSSNPPLPRTPESTFSASP